MSILTASWAISDKHLDLVFSSSSPSWRFEFTPRTNGRWAIVSTSTQPLDAEKYTASETSYLESNMHVEVRLPGSEDALAIWAPRLPPPKPLVFQRHERPLMTILAAARYLPADGRRVRLYIAIAEEQP